MIVKLKFPYRKKYHFVRKILNVEQLIMKKLFEYILYLKYHGRMLGHWSGYIMYDVHDRCWIVNAGRYKVATEYDIEVYRIPDKSTVSGNFDDGHHRAIWLCNEINRTPIDHELFI